MEKYVPRAQAVDREGVTKGKRLSISRIFLDSVSKTFKVS